MSKVEEATHDFCTRCFKYNKCTKSSSECTLADSYEEGYEEGYRQAEKDSGLTWEDVVHIIETYNELEFSREFATVTFNDTCKEVLKRFKNLKK